jgi:hypothetical protein
MLAHGGAPNLVELVVEVVDQQIVEGFAIHGGQPSARA